jgi:hypothetical protein
MAGAADSRGPARQQETTSRARADQALGIEGIRRVVNRHGKRDVGSPISDPTTCGARSPDVGGHQHAAHAERSDGVSAAADKGHDRHPTRPG